MTDIAFVNGVNVVALAAIGKNGNPRVFYGSENPHLCVTDNTPFIAVRITARIHRQLTDNERQFIVVPQFAPIPYQRRKQGIISVRVSFVRFALIPQNAAQCIRRDKLHHAVIQHPRRTRVARCFRSGITVFAASRLDFGFRSGGVCFNILVFSCFPSRLITLIIAVIGNRLFGGAF